MVFSLCFNINTFSFHFYLFIIFMVLGLTWCRGVGLCNGLYFTMFVVVGWLGNLTLMMSWPCRKIKPIIVFKCCLKCRIVFKNDYLIGLDTIRIKAQDFRLYYSLNLLFLHLDFCGLNIYFIQLNLCRLHITIHYSLIIRLHVSINSIISNQVSFSLSFFSFQTIILDGVWVRRRRGLVVLTVYLLFLFILILILSFA